MFNVLFSESAVHVTFNLVGCCSVMYICQQYVIEFFFSVERVQRMFVIVCEMKACTRTERAWIGQ